MPAAPAGGARIVTRGGTEMTDANGGSPRGPRDAPGYRQRAARFAGDGAPCHGRPDTMSEIAHVRLFTST